MGNVVRLDRVASSNPENSARADAGAPLGSNSWTPLCINTASTVLGLLTRARQLFGGDTPPADPPAFVAPADLEADLGRGRF